MVVLSPPEQVATAGVGAPLPHLQDCVYLGEQNILVSQWTRLVRP